MCPVAVDRVSLSEQIANHGGSPVWHCPVAHLSQQPSHWSQKERPVNGLCPVNRATANRARKSWRTIPEAGWTSEIGLDSAVCVHKGG